MGWIVEGCVFGSCLLFVKGVMVVVLGVFVCVLCLGSW